MNGIAFGVVSGVGTYIVVGNSGAIFTSTDLVTWTQRVSNPPNTNNLYGVAFLNGGFVAIGASGALLTSTDGSNWVTQTSNAVTTLRGAAFRSSPALYVVVGDAGTIVTSTDGTTWNPIAPPLSPNPNLSSVRFGSRFVAVGQGGAVAYSDDGMTWPMTSAGSADLSGVVFTPAMYVAVGAAGANAIAK
jgi:photosystem II stability/assembly factor-like uncharacterized protein